MLNLHTTTPAPSLQPDSPVPPATTSKPEPMACPTAGTLASQASFASSLGISQLHPSPVVEQPVGSAQHAAPLDESQRASSAQHAAPLDESQRASSAQHAAPLDESQRASSAQHAAPLDESQHASPAQHAAPLDESQHASPAQHAAPLDESQRGQLPEQVEGRQVLHLEQVEAAALHSTIPGAQPGLLHQPSGQLGHVAAAVDLPEQGGAVPASGEVLQVPGPLGEASQQQTGEGPAVSPRKGVAHAAPGSLQEAGGQQRGGPPAGSPGGGSRLVNAAQGRERTEAARRSTRNSLLLSLHRVAVSALPQFQDLPIDDSS